MPPHILSIPTHAKCSLRICERRFSSMPMRQTRLRRDMFKWLNTVGKNFKTPLKGSTNYLSAYTPTGQLIRTLDRARPKRQDDALVEDDDETQVTERRIDSISNAEFESGKLDPHDRTRLPKEDENDLMPFPQNRQFRSQPVLSEELRNEIYKRIVDAGKSVKVVSVELGVEMNRVAAVVRLKEIEKRWLKEGRPLAIPYARAVNGMLPKTPLTMPPTPHESINDLPLHPWTRPQMFVPVPESRHFTSADAARAFNDRLLPPEKRIPHPELVELERERLEGVPLVERRQRAVAREAREKLVQQQQENKEKNRARKRTVEHARFSFVFADVRVEDAGRDGRSAEGTGWRYGTPHQDRKRGAVKIPTRV